MAKQTLSEHIEEYFMEGVDLDAIELTQEEVRLGEDYFNAISKLNEEESLLAFKTVIRSKGRCGFANGGTVQRLHNTDPGARYRVTVRTFWRSGIENGQSDRTHIVEAGGIKVLGCSRTSHIPVTYYSRQVVGEVRI